SVTHGEPPLQKSKADHKSSQKSPTLQQNRPSLFNNLFNRVSPRSQADSKTSIFPPTINYSILTKELSPLSAEFPSPEI
ncbi:hypothetical protein, partial [uncultured Duncaniella sp.]|uniref:hypothetical protein n=1 Tax=uncultured Duncaniella sp. TaxID=2768039 RepID=UPI0025B6D893